MLNRKDILETKEKATNHDKCLIIYLIVNIIDNKADIDFKML